MSTNHEFQTEVKQLLDLMIHSLYSHREIFLRELVSNASDACDKLRFQALTDKDLLKGDDDLKVTVRPDKEAGTVVIEDNGIGLTEQDAVEQLGTIAKSGTKEFVRAVSGGDKKEGDLAGLIGQFGVGFYSVFMVADKVVVESRHAAASSDDGVRWESAGDGSFVTERIARPQRGTTITVHFKEDATEFADTWRLRGLIKKYSDYVSYGIFLPKELTEDEKKEGKEPELEQVNEGKALWTRNKDEITDEQYKEFYQGACKQWDDPATRLHFSVEGTLCFTALLFVPSTKPMDLFDRGAHGLSLYVRRVFIMDDCTELLPEYLRFVRGVVDSDDLPLNVSREMLQEEATVRRLRKILVKRILDHLEKLGTSDDEDESKAFATIDEQFGPIMREGVVNDFENKDRLLKLVRYQSTWTDEQEQGEDDKPFKTSLDDYIARMGEDQDTIYYITAPSLAAARHSPHLEGYRRKGWEVLYLVDPVDEWVANHLTTYEEKKVASVLKGDADLGEEDKKALKKQEKAYKDFTEFCKEHLGGVKEVRLTSRLTDSPCCLVADEQDMTANMAEIMRRFGQDMPPSERILELNPEHELVKKLHDLHQEKADDPRLGEMVQVLRDQAMLAEGGRIDDPATFARKVQDLMSRAL